MDARPIKTNTYNSSRAKISDGKSVLVQVPENTTIEAQMFYELEGFFGAATESVTTGEGQTAEVVLTIEQAEYESDQIMTTKQFDVGAPLYFKDGKFTPDASTGVEPDVTSHRLVGRVTQSKDANNVILFILGPQV
ncbi:capsid cement protein [Rummeliibacillus sp. POC4]|uniref:capsid cement protein n=1 Tax=Rummeliibacillus sp. POC4 TaxID=2305899 RepID=UPI000E661409|nr:capsid cement protein [Rummeliibacillus sp. POC4]RIJ63612.1 hypothetical protein D1606_14120 [Rummeliibacillus sp. POC4]